MLWKSLHVQLFDDSNDTAVSAIVMHCIVTKWSRSCGKLTKTNIQHSWSGSKILILTSIFRVIFSVLFSFFFVRLYFAFRKTLCDLVLEIRSKSILSAMLKHITHYTLHRQPLYVFSVCMRKEVEMATTKNMDSNLKRTNNLLTAVAVFLLFLLPLLPRNPCSKLVSLTT